MEQEHGFLARITIKVDEHCQQFLTPLSSCILLHAFFEIRAQPPTDQCPPQTKTCVLIPEHA